MGLAAATLESLFLGKSVPRGSSVVCPPVPRCKYGGAPPRPYLRQLRAPMPSRLIKSCTNVVVFVCGEIGELTSRCAPAGLVWLLAGGVAVLAILKVL